MFVVNNELGKTRACGLPNLREDHVVRDGVPYYRVGRLLIAI